MDIWASLFFGVHIIIHIAALLKYPNSGMEDDFSISSKAYQFLRRNYSRNVKKRTNKVRNIYRSSQWTYVHICWCGRVLKLSKRKYTVRLFNLCRNHTSSYVEISATSAKIKRRKTERMQWIFFELFRNIWVILVRPRTLIFRVVCAQENSQWNRGRRLFPSDQ